MQKTAAQEALTAFQEKLAQMTPMEAYAFAQGQEDNARKYRNVGLGVVGGSALGALASGLLLKNPQQRRTALELLGVTGVGGAAGADQRRQERP